MHSASLRGDTKHNINIDMAKNNGHGRASILSDDQFQQLLDAAPTQTYRTLWTLQRATAARISEALNLRWCDVEGGHITFRKATTKTQQTRQIPISPALQQELNALKPEGAGTGDYLFHAKDSTTQPLSRNAADKALRKVCDRVGLEGVSTHSFRRTAATNLANNFPLHAVMQFTGHASLGAIQSYLEADPAQLQSMTAFT